MGAEGGGRHPDPLLEGECQVVTHPNPTGGRELCLVTVNQVSLAWGRGIILKTGSQVPGTSECRGPLPCPLPYPWRQPGLYPPGRVLKGPLWRVRASQE